MKKTFIILTALTFLFGLICNSLMADELPRDSDSPRRDVPEARQERAARGDRDRDPDASNSQRGRMRGRPAMSNEAMAMELDRLKAENDLLKDEVQHLKQELLELLVDQIERQREQIDNLRMMMEEQYDFMRRLWEDQQHFTRGLLEKEYEMRATQTHLEIRRLEMMGEEGRNEEEENIERMLMEIEHAIEEDPEDPGLRVKLAYTYWEVDDPERAMEQFKMALTIDPDFDEAFHGLEKLREEYPDISREPRELHGAMGRVVFANKEGVKLETEEGHMEFIVPYRKTEEGEQALNDDVAELVGSLDTGVLVKILWDEKEDHRIIRRIERIEDEDRDEEHNEE